MKVKELLTQGFNILKSNGIDTYIIDTELILGKVIGLDRLSIILNRERLCSEEEISLFFRLIEDRRKRKPVRYITEAVEFMGLDLFIKDGVLIPRPDTETLTEEAISIIKQHKYEKICDLCCGSGAIGIAIAKYTENTQVAFLDISQKAIEVTKINIEKQNISDKTIVFMSDLLKKAEENGLEFDIIVSNPPYISEKEIPELMEDVKCYEPTLALSGGEDGLDFYKKITAESRKVLKNGGALAYEIGCSQYLPVKEIMMDNGFRNIYCMRDLSGKDRAIFGFL